MRAFPLVIIGLLMALGVPTGARAVPCPVPSGTHPTIQTAVDDPGCTEITLGSQTYIESVTIDRSLELSGVSAASTVIVGRVGIEGASTVVTLAELTVDGSDPAVAGCFVEAVAVEEGAQMSGSNIVVLNGDGYACTLFGDGFEDGTTDAWANTAP